MLNKNILVFIILSILSLTLYSDNNKPNNKTDKKNWKFSTFLAYSIAKGNSNGETYSGQAQYSYKKEKLGFTASYEQYYGKNNDIININKGKGFITASRTIKDSLNLSSSATYEYDKIASLSYRFNYGLGLSYENRDNSKNTFSFSSNIVYELSHYNSDIKEDKKSFRLLMLLITKFNFFNNSSFQTSLSYTPSLIDFNDDFRIEIKSALKFLINGPLWFKLSLLNQYNNLPPSDKIKKNDFTFVTGIEVSI